jgi:predicted dinucleotide-binding enzyme
MRIGILGSGLMGGKLGAILARAGHEVVFSYAHDFKKLERLAREAGKNAKAGTPEEAARGSQAVFLAVHWTRVDDVLEKAGDLSGKLLLSCSLPMNEDDSHLVIGHTSSGAEALAAKAKGAHVVAAFNTVPSEVLYAVFAARRRKARPDLIYCGDNKSAKKRAAGLIRDVGFNPVDLGGLEIARYMEPFGLAVAELAYSGKNSPALAYHFEKFRERGAG